MTAPVTKSKFEKALRLFEETGNVSEVARLMGEPRPTVQVWIQNKDRYLARFNMQAPDLAGELRDQVRTLTAELKARKAATLDAAYVERKIIKLTEQKPSPPTWLLTPQSEKHGVTGVPTLMASDWHWGEVVDMSQIGRVNKYNIEIAHARARMLIQSTIDLLDNHMVNPSYPGMVFILGGDMVTGDIHEELTATNAMEIMPTIIDLFGVLIWCITTLANKFGKLFVPCVTGNHGRNTHKIRAKGRNFTSFDWLLYKMLEKHFERDERVTFAIPDGSDCLYQVYGHRYLLTHGDQFRGGDGMIGHLGPVFRGNHKKSSRNVQIGMEYDTMVIGHFHTLAMLPRIITNGSLIGYNEYAYAGNFTFEPPQQALWLTHPERGITISMPVQVAGKGSKIAAGEWVKWQK